MNWIKYSEQLPEDGQLVNIIYATNGRIYEAAVATYRAPHFHLFDGLWAGADVNTSIDFAATHWQPLPAAPEVN